jgi:hypothetical protein
MTDHEKDTHTCREDFAPFARYMANRGSLTKYLNFSRLAFGIAVATLADDDVKGEPIDPAKIKLSDTYTEADISIKARQPLVRLGYTR